ncbi:MAG: HipA domain-containing protein [Azonexus sp.]|nr:HipA domain-containing protein [Azonexus sp.]
MTNGISESALYVGLYLPGEEAPTTAALLKLDRNNLQESGHLAYGLGYLERPAALALNPLHLPLQRDTFRLPAHLLRDGGALPLSIKDALPGAWGLRVLANELAGRLPSEREQLLLTNADRVGAMVFSASRDMPPPAELPHDEYPQLSQLADAVRRLQYDMDIPPPLKRLLLRGGSLGGARPKASFMHDDALWLAKFPAAGDPLDVQVLEATALGLALRCGIQVPQFMTLPVGRSENAFLSRRFDRLGERAQQRLHYLSASALLDIPYESSAGSYVEFARVIRRLSLRPGADLKELFRRLIFNLLIDNTDDHLKNHGMLWAGRDRYVLSPAFDVVPQLTHLGYQMLSIDGTTQESSLELTVQSAAHFDLSADQASAIIKEIAGIVYGQWWLHAKLQDVPDTLRKRLTSCFDRQKEIIGAAKFGY